MCTVHVVLECIVATNDDVASIISMCLRHRLRKDPLESIDSGTKVREVFETVFA